MDGKVRGLSHPYFHLSSRTFVKQNLKRLSSLLQDRKALLEIINEMEGRDDNLRVK